MRFKNVNDISNALNISDNEKVWVEPFDNSIFKPLQTESPTFGRIANPTNEIWMLRLFVDYSLFP